MNLLRSNLTAHVVGYRHTAPLTIRWASRDDTELLQMLSDLDEAAVPPAPVLLGFVDDELWAAVSVSTGAKISDPFKPSGEVARLVAERGRQLTVSGRRTRLGLGTAARRRPLHAGLA